MAVYFYASPEAAEPTRRAVMSFTHDDHFKPIAGYKTMVNHFHLGSRSVSARRDRSTTPFQDLMVMRAAGINIVGLSDFHGDLRAPIRAGAFGGSAGLRRGLAKASDKDFLVTPWEEPSAYFGGHYNILFPKNVYWIRRCVSPSQPFTEDVAGFGKVYHTASAEDVQQMLDAENGYWFHAHPRTKGTTGYPDAILEKACT